MKFEEAFEALMAGKPVRHQHFSCYNWQLVNGKLIENRKWEPKSISLRFQSLVDAKSIWPEGWELYVAPLRFKDLKPGQKFRYKNGKNIKCIRVDESYKYVTLDSGNLLTCGDIEAEVTLLD